MRDLRKNAEDRGGTSSNETGVSRRGFVASAAFASVGMLMPAPDAQAQQSGTESLADTILEEKIRRSMLAGPPSITKDATVAEMTRQGEMTILRRGTNKWICMPGNQNIIGSADMCLDPIGLQWFKDLLARKPKPSNTVPGLIYMLNGANQRSFTDPFDETSPAIPIGPHWMLIWPFDAEASGLPAIMRDAGALVMFAGTPYAHLHICGSPWDGNEYIAGDQAVWTMFYKHP